jgi:hypothetical protein
MLEEVCRVKKTSAIMMEDDADYAHIKVRSVHLMFHLIHFRMEYLNSRMYGYFIAVLKLRMDKMNDVQMLGVVVILEFFFFCHACANIHIFW